MTELSARLRELDAEAVSAPWWSCLHEHGAVITETREGGMDEGPVLAYSENYDEGTFALIVALRNNTPEIIAALEAVERVRELHAPTQEEVIAWSCVYGECEEGHLDECPILTITTCAECSRLVFEETDEPGNVPTFPCPTIRALDGE